MDDDVSVDVSSDEVDDYHQIQGYYHRKQQLLLDASIEGNVIKIKRLLKRMSPAARISGSSLGLRQAARHNQTEAIKLLLTYGCAVNNQNIEGDTALHCAARYDSAAATELLLKSGADTTIKNDEKQTPLDVARQEVSLEVIRLLKNI